MTRGRKVRIGLAAATLAALAACEEPPAPAPVPDPVPEAVPAPPPPPDPAPEVQPRSEASTALAAYYRRLQANLLAQGLMRTDGGGPDTAFTGSQLGRNFVRIALFDEYTQRGEVLEARQTLSTLRRWEGPVRMQVGFGASVPEDQRVQDRNAIGAYARRLGRVTGHPVSTVQDGGNFHVLVLNEDDRLAYGDSLRALVPGIAESSVRAFLSPPRSTLCLVIAFSDGSSPGYTQAVALIRGEHPDALRLACIHEELAQGLGLPNDSPLARPSIFNDDDEFALLTGHDEMLLRILYDDRLRAGMSAAEAAPIGRAIAEELLGGGA
ncbi:DUF2927 domain-containing protein [Wenxinia saemankumensis]|uniref:DUF2927 domain-containing protein n=1 Tax=Wenxinia saemankumensis TaxID=1447782 RepID=A0A1M6ENM1_9RHOB|nr:DUF2927 domain-containing protein [Wenxinia saemankumensis]SHI87003.1 Protein of unknown function [Wenxinia saemankumensis]